MEKFMTTVYFDAENKGELFLTKGQEFYKVDEVDVMIAEMKVEIEYLREVHNTAYKLMVTGEQRGAVKAKEELAELRELNEKLLTMLKLVKHGYDNHFEKYPTVYHPIMENLAGFIEVIESEQ